MKPLQLIPGVPAAGHVSPGGFWHPGRAEGCLKCPTLETPPHQVQLSDVERCPRRILSPRHYREDGSCRCDQ